MIWILILLTLVLALTTLRMRARLAAIHVLAESSEPASADHRIIAAAGVTVDDATVRAASAWARDNKLDILDLVPRDLPAIRAMTLAQLVDPASYRKDRVGPGRSAGHAILVTADVAKRAGLAADQTPLDEVAFVKLAVRLKHYGRGDLVIAPAEHARPTDLSRRIDVLRALIGPSTTMALAILPVMLAVMALGIWLSPIAGLVALGTWHLQPLIAIAGTGVRSRDLVLVTLFRTPIELWVVIATVFGRRGDREPDPRLALRPEYERLIASGRETWQEPRRETCPVCDGRDLVVYMRTTDLIQHKPGRFTLERCRGCQHLFQNPRLSLAGLDFYYKDFYDGLGEAGLEFIFGYGAERYHARAQMVRDLAVPVRWLDVGAGHGHFCAAARDDLPDTRFDGLDFGESIDEAQRRGWIDTAYRGLFPDLAPQLAGRYDAISMSHYLEHTLDQRRELAAARIALAPKGHLLIELPDPEFVLGRVLGRFWLPWFQPQHLNLLSAGNLDKLLREHGFTSITWHRGQTHQRVDFFFAAWLWLGRIAPPRRLPWRWRGPVTGAWRVLVWTLGSPLIVGGIIVDNLIGGFFERSRVSNTYRVVARRDDAPAADPAAV